MLKKLYGKLESSINALESWMTVSYTHLDVYKRQA